MQTFDRQKITHLQDVLLLFFPVQLPIGRGYQTCKRRNEKKLGLTVTEPFTGNCLVHIDTSVADKVI